MEFSIVFTKYFVYLCIHLFYYLPKFTKQEVCLFYLLFCYFYLFILFHTILCNVPLCLGTFIN